MKILFLSQRVPEPPNKGDKIRSHHLMRRLATRHSVHLACLLDEPAERQHAVSAGEWATTVTARLRRSAESAVRGAASALSGNPMSVGFFRSRALAADVRRLLALEQFDVVVAYCSSMASYTESFDGPKVLDFVDVDSEKWRQYAERSGLPRKAVYALEYRLLRSYEARLVGTFDHCVIISPREREVLARFTDPANVHVVTNGVDTDWLARQKARPRTADLVFVGALDYFANAEGISGFATDAFPEVRRRLPEAMLRVVGRKPGAEVCALGARDGVEVVGEVDDMRPELWRAAIAVVPLRIAQGLQNKVLEAMAAGVPVVSSPAAVRGVEGRAGEHFLTADSPAQWAGAIESLVRDPERAEELAANARRLVLERYSWDRKAVEYEAVLEAAIAGRRAAELAGGAAVKNALTIDVEDWFQVSNFDGIVSRSEWERYPSRVVDNTRRLLEVFAERDVHGTFFVLGWVAERFPALVGEIRDAGHEVASHGWGHELVYELGPERFAEDLDRSIAALDAAAGVRPRGYRAPSFSIDHRAWWAFDVLAERGFTYDSSVFPVRHPRYGTPSFARVPRRVRTRHGSEILEFPLTTLRLLGRNLGAAGGGYLRLLPLSVLTTAFRLMNDAGQPAVLYLHPWEIDPDQPRLPVRGLGRITHYTNLASTLDRLRTVLTRFRFATMEEALRDAPDLAETPIEVGGVSPSPNPVLLARSGVFLECWREVFATMRRPQVFALLLPFAVVQGLFVAALYSFPRPPWGNLLKPVFLAAGGEAALHYPDAYLFLPRVFLWTNAGLSFLVGSVCVAAVAGALPSVFLRARPDLRSALATASSRLPRIWAAALPFLIVVGGAMVVADLVAAVNGAPTREGVALALGIRAFAFVLHALLAYSVIAVAVGDLSAGAAIRRSFHLATRNFWTTLGFVAATSLLLLPVAWLESDPAARFRVSAPDVALALVAARAVLSLLATYLLVAACTRLYLHWFGAPVIGR